MTVARYRVRGRIEIDATPGEVYAIAADPAMVPLYAPEVERIEVIERIGERESRVRSRLRIGPFRRADVYRYRYVRGRSYAGIQERGRLFRGYFAFSFVPCGGRTVVTHVEGIASAVPGLARFLGFVYFRVLARGGIGEELRRLKGLVEERSRGRGGKG